MLGSPGSRVVSVIAATPSARNGACSPAAYGIPRSTSCESAEGMAGGRPACSVTRADAVLTSVRAGELEPPPEMTRRGLPRPPIPSRTIVAIACSASGDVSREARGPGATVSAGVGRDEDQRPLEERGGHVSLSAQTPRELDERGRPRRVVSSVTARRCLDGRRGRSPPRTAPARRSTMFRSSTSPRSTRSVAPDILLAVSPSAEIVSLYQRAAPAASSVPGTREGNSVESSVATAAATEASNSGSRVGRGSVPVVEIENKSARAAGAMTSELTRTRRALRGLATVPRRLRPRGRAASIAGL